MLCYLESHWCIPGIVYDLQRFPKGLRRSQSAYLKGVPLPLYLGTIGWKVLNPLGHLATDTDFHQLLGQFAGLDLVKRIAEVWETSVNFISSVPLFGYLGGKFEELGLTAAFVPESVLVVV